MKIDLGCGTKKKEGYFGIDKLKLPGVDLVCDCNKKIPLEDNIADEINATAFLEHLDNNKKIHIMNEIYRLLKPGGIFTSYTPSTDGRGAFQDPTHTAYWNENSFQYYTDNEYREMYGIKALFEIIAIKTTKEDSKKVCFVEVKMKAIKKVPPMKFSIICATNNEEILKNNLLSSAGLDDHQLIIKRDATNVPRTYNDAMEEATEAITIFVHHDVILPSGFFHQLEQAIKNLDGKSWGVLGVAGLQGNNRYGYLLNRTSKWGNENLVPHEVDTLDELILITKTRALKFDENIPSTHHMFGADICMQAKDQGMTNYAILAYCIHNCALHGSYPKDFYDSAEYIKEKWAKFLPITTTCTVIR